MNGRPILKVMQDGVGFVCAHCERFWWGVDRGYGSCWAKAVGKDCSGPMGGGSFQEYEGPLKGNLCRFCFVCGKEPSGVACTKHGKVGVCRDHMEWLGSYSRPNERPPFVTHKHVDTIGDG